MYTYDGLLSDFNQSVATTRSMHRLFSYLLANIGNKNNNANIF